jgi:hypothetical protein
VEENREGIIVIADFVMSCFRQLLRCTSYTADLANRLAQAGHDVHLVTTSWAPHDRYISAVYHPYAG